MNELPFGLTSSELLVLRAAYKAGYFTPGSCSCRKPKKIMKLKDLAQQVGISPLKYSRLLSSAQKKVIFSVIKENIPFWVKEWP